MNKWLAVFLAISLFSCNGGQSGGSGGSGGTNDPGGNSQSVISLSVTSLNFTAEEAGNNPDSQSFSISNTGSGTLSFACAEQASWLTLSSTAGTAPGNITVNVDITGLDDGNYAGTITVSSSSASNSPKTVAVNLIINPRLEGWISFREINEKAVYQISLASDSSGNLTSNSDRLVAYFREYDPILANLDKGIIKEWNGNTWVELWSPTLQSHSPDVAVEGEFVAISDSDDGQDYVFHSNWPAGLWSGVTSTLLLNQAGMNVTFAMGRPYMAYISNQQMYIKTAAGSGSKREVYGSWGRKAGDWVSQIRIAGDQEAWYIAYYANWGLYVDRATVNTYENLGGSLNFTNAWFIRLDLYEGIPVVAWVDGDELKNVFVKKRVGGRVGWSTIGESVVDKKITGFRFAASGKDLYLAYILDNQDLIINKYDGANWTVIPSPAGPFIGGSVVFFDIAVYKGELCIAYSQDGIVEIKRYIPPLNSSALMDFELQLNPNRIFN
jgi:hypothetical protein